jgi:hypothetical protein
MPDSRVAPRWSRCEPLDDWHYAHRDERYDYLYTALDSESFGETLKTVKPIVRKSYGYMNDHAEAKAVADVIELKHLLGEPVPGNLKPATLKRDPELKAIVPVKARQDARASSEIVIADMARSECSLFRSAGKETVRCRCGPLSRPGRDGAAVVVGRPRSQLRHGDAVARRHIRMVAMLCVVIVFALAATIAAIAPDVVSAVDAIPAHLAGRFRESRGFSQAAAGHFLIFDRRAHAVFGIDAAMSASYPIVEIGAEPGRLLGPTAFSAAADGSFVVADAPRGQERVQVFSPSGQLLQLFLLPGPARTRVMIDGFSGSGVAGLHYTGRSVLVSQPEWGGLITEYSLLGQPVRTFGRLRATDHESDPDVHLALNSGLALAAPDGGYFFVFQAGQPVFRKYDAQGGLQFERQVQGREIDAVVASLPERWPRGAGEEPMIAPTVRAAAVDPKGQLWIALSVPYTYVFDGDGDKVRVVQFRAGGVLTPSSLAFGTDGRLLTTPGLAIFDPALVSNLPADATILTPVTLQPDAPSGGNR